MNKTIKIGPQTFKIFVVQGLQDSEFKSLDGIIKLRESSICLDKRMDDFALKQTLWHEILHGLAIQAGEEVSEGAINALAYGIMGALQDNVWLTKKAGKT